MRFRVTACTTMGHLLDMNHRPETLESARRWAREIASLPGFRHVLIAESQEYILETIRGHTEGHSGDGSPAGDKPEQARR